MSKWLIVVEETVAADAAPTHRQVKVIQQVRGNKTREEALVELRNVARRYTPDLLKGTPKLVGLDSDGSFWVLPKSGKGNVSCNLRLIEQIHP
ncbi:hypothetical protein [Streptomyces sp. NPDC001851]|uniref:hypothetical protein n=1 Tax=Streptomyces sp. NPDC001851 TaxID=3154529 RepID=UPI00332F4A1A